MPRINQQQELIQLLISRLERLSADSLWAHRASGIRGALLRASSQLEEGQKVDHIHLEGLVKHGFEILESVARE